MIEDPDKVARRVRASPTGRPIPCPNLFDSVRLGRPADTKLATVCLGKGVFPAAG
jgi:hypothetical protein